MEALATASPQLAFENLNPLRTAVRSITLFSSITLVCLLGYVSFRVFHARQWLPPGWRVVWDMQIRTGRQATVVAMLFLSLAVVVMAYGVLIVSLPGPVPEEVEVPIQEV